jgi:hypothetical protein
LPDIIGCMTQYIMGNCRVENAHVAFAIQWEFLPMQMPEITIDAH